MNDDPSRGWDAVADRFIAARSEIGLETVRRWAAALPPGGTIIDIGAGSGAPLAAGLVADGHRLYAIEPAPRLAAAFRALLPDTPIACEPVEIGFLVGTR